MTTPRVLSRRARAVTANRFPGEKHYRWLAGVLGVALVAYLLFDKAFAWVHVPGIPVFTGEVVLVGGIFLIGQSAQLGRLLRLSRPLQLLGLYMLWGLILAYQGYAEWGLDAIRDSALWYYGAFAFIAAGLLLIRPQIFDQLDEWVLRLLPYALAIWVFRLAFANVDINIYVPDSTVRIFVHKTANIAVAAAIALSYLLVVIGPPATKQLRDRYTRYTLAGLLLIVAVGSQSRGGFVAAAIVLTAVFVLARHARQAMMWVLTVGALLAMLALAMDVKFQLDRRELSTAQVAENIGSIISETTTGDRGDNTTQWRLFLWSQALDQVFDREHVVAGFGFGENLADRFKGEESTKALPLRNPHNSHLSVLARMGVVGAALWLALLAVWYAQLAAARRWYRMVGEPRKAARVAWVMLAVGAILINAFFDPTIEGPQVGVLTWCLFGYGSVLALQGRPTRSLDRGDTGLLLHEQLPADPVLPPEYRQVLEKFDNLLEE
jgi:O-antigen ligase